jgi:hypothetical protein
MRPATSGRRSRICGSGTRLACRRVGVPTALGLVKGRRPRRGATRAARCVPFPGGPSLHNPPNVRFGDRDRELLVRYGPKTSRSSRAGVPIVRFLILATEATPLPRSRAASDPNGCEKERGIDARLIRLQRRSETTIAGRLPTPRTLHPGARPSSTTRTVTTTSRPATVRRRRRGHRLCLIQPGRQAEQNRGCGRCERELR